MPAPSGFLSALGQMFQGYAQDEQGRFQRDQRQQESSRADASLDLQRRNIEDEIRQRNAPKPVARQFVNDRGGFVGDDGTFTPVAGLPAIVEKPIKPEWEQHGFKTPGEYLKFKGQEASVTRAPEHENWVSAGIDPKTNEPLVMNSRTGETRPGGGLHGGRGGGSQLGQQVRPLAAMSEARAAMPRMYAYEDKMLANPAKATPSFLTQMGGKLATRMSGQHSLTGIAAETVGENVTDPEYLQYVRDAGLMARATQLMSSRGGSEAMVSAEQLLNRAVPHTDAAGLHNSVSAARKSRDSIFGKFGAIAQALTPEQTAKIEAGLAALEKGEQGPAVDAARAVMAEAEAAQPPAQPLQHAPSAPAAPASLPPLSVTDRARANSNPAFKSWLVSQGYKL